MGEVWGVFYEDFGENWSYYNGTTLYMVKCVQQEYYFNSLRPRQNGRHFADNVFKQIFLN